MIRAFVAIAMISALATPARAAGGATLTVQQAMKMHRVKATHVADFTDPKRLAPTFGMPVKLHRGPEGARHRGQFSLARGSRLLAVIPDSGAKMVQVHELMRPQDFGRPEWYASARRQAATHSPYEILDGRIPLQGGKQAVVVRVKRNVPKASERLAGSNLVLQLVKPDKRSSKPLNLIYALQAHLVGGRAD